jgi:hypothetical protein
MNSKNPKIWFLWEKIVFSILIILGVNAYIHKFSALFWLIVGATTMFIVEKLLKK